MRWMSATMIASGLLMMAATSPVTAADPGFCRHYANAALNQVRGGLSLPPCRHELEGSRWSSDFHVHFDWCLGVSPEEAAAERNRRTAELERCRYR